MNDDYPDEEDLARIREWDYHDFPGLLAFARSIWWCADWGWRQDGRQYDVSTGGWSGNEEIIDALQENFMFWSCCWQSSRRGGHFKFEIPDWTPTAADAQRAIEILEDSNGK